MIIKLLGFADLLAVIALLAITILPQNLVLLMAIYLIAKGTIFMIIGGPLPNIFDILSGVYLAIAAFGFVHWIPTVIVMLYILQKAFLSFMN